MSAEDFIAEARERFSATKDAWREIRAQFTADARFVSGDPTEQWDPQTFSARQAANRPALSFGRLHVQVNESTAQARHNRPEPQVLPGEGGNQATAQMIEARLRHIMYVSQSDAVLDQATDYMAAGGIGWVRVNTEYRPGKTFNQDIKLCGILDPMSVYPDFKAVEPDFSDMQFCFVRKPITRREYKEKYGQDPVPFDEGDRQMQDWVEGPNKDDIVWIAEYWRVVKQKRMLVLLDDGSVLFKEELEANDPRNVISEREYEERKVKYDLIDGARTLETTESGGQWIPIVPFLGQQRIVDGKRRLISVIRYARDPQKLLNAYKSGIAENIFLPSRAPWIGAKGQFKDPRWKDANQQNYAYLEYEPVDVKGNPAPPPQRNIAEAPINSLSAAAMQEADDIKASCGYQDAILTPSQAQLSGVALQRRQDQQASANSFIVDNQRRALWHVWRIMVDLFPVIYDTPQMLDGRTVDGVNVQFPVTQQQPDGSVPMVPGQESAEHHRLDQGDYVVTVSSGPSYATRQQDEKDTFLAISQANPAIWAQAGDILFKLLGYPDLEKRVQMFLPPQVQQNIQAAPGQQIPPEVQAQLAQLTQQNRLLQQNLHQLLMERQGKLLEIGSKEKIATQDNATKVVVESMKHQHDAAKTLHLSQMEGIAKQLDMLHESELAPPPTAPEDESGTVQT